MFESIYRALNEEYDYTENSENERSKAFNKAYRDYVKKAIKPYGYTLVKSKGSAYCESSGFVTDNNGHYIYFNSGDYRYDLMCKEEWRNKVLYRGANDSTDYRGYCNRYCTLRELGEKVNEYFSKKLYEKEIREISKW